MKKTTALAAVCAAFCFSASTAHAATINVSLPFTLGGQFDNGDLAGGTPVDLSLTYGDGGLTGASYAINGYAGSFDSVSLTGYSTHVRTAYNNTVNGLELTFTIDPNPLVNTWVQVTQSQWVNVQQDNFPIDGIPHATIDLNMMSMVFAYNPASATGIPVMDGNVTEAELTQFFTSGTTLAALDYRYFANGQARNYQGGFNAITPQLVSDVQNGGGEVDVTTVPLPAGVPLLLSGLAVVGLLGRRRAALSRG